MTRKDRRFFSTCIVFALAAGPACSAGAREPGAGRPVRGVILFIGDGMGIATVTAARIHRGFLEGRVPPSSARLFLDGAPRSALVHTWAKDCMVTDSAAGATALATGHKAVNGALSAAAVADGVIDSLRTLLEIAEAIGLSTGLVTTTTVTHATPAAFYAHTLDRGKETTIAEALVPGKGNPRLGDGIEVILGGGRGFWLPEALPGGRRTDGRNLVSEMKDAGYRVVEDRESLERSVRDGVGRVVGLFSPSHMAYEADREATSPAEPTLAEMTRAAVQILGRNPRGFFLMVEGGRIDHALHFNYGYRAVTDMLEFDAAVAEARGLLGDEAFILATADHDHGMVITGEPAPDADVFSPAGKDKNGKPFTALLFATGPSAAKALPDTLPPDLLRNPEFQERAGVPLEYEEHGAMDVPLYAFGPERCFGTLHGSMENTEVFEILRAAIEDR